MDTLRHEIKSTNEVHSSALQREVERLQMDIDRLRAEIRYETEKLTAGQRLDLNLEKGRIRDELDGFNEKTVTLEAQLYREVNTLKTQLEATKNEIIKYSIGTLFSMTAVGLAMLRVIL